VTGNIHNNGGTIAAGLSPGTLNIFGDITQTASNFEVEIAGLAPGQFDIFNVDGAVNFLGGSILFIFLDGFLPKSDDVVNFVFADAILGLNNISSTRAGPGTWIRVRRCGRRVRRAAVPGSHRCDCGARACLNGALRRRTARLGLLSRRRKAA
jgi:hypothetical protein